MYFYKALYQTFGRQACLVAFSLGQPPGQCVLLPLPQMSPAGGVAAPLAGTGDVLEGLEVMAESAAHCYEVQTGRAFIPSAGGRNGKQAKQSGAIFEARQWIEAHERDQAERNKVTGTRLAIAGAREWSNHAQIWDMLDRIKGRFLESFGQELILYHKGDRKGVDAIAAAWARARGVAQVEFKPNWKAHGKGAGFKAIDQMLGTYRPLGGVAIFGATGIALNLAQKAEAKGIKAMRVTEKPAETAEG